MGFHSFPDYMGYKGAMVIIVLHRTAARDASHPTDGINITLARYTENKQKMYIFVCTLASYL
jgi:hypothetical protein